MKLRRVVIAVAGVLFGLALAAGPAAAQTGSSSSSSSDYTLDCPALTGNSLGVANAAVGHLSARTVAQEDPDCPSTAVKGATVTATKVEAGAVQSTPLARTGSSDTIPLTRIGLGLLAAGGLVVLVARRRRTTSAAA
ncbi:MAG TPA: LPXTG cell wall anchor domain-containing protein [Acidimicrobiales bacterium]|jgi:LPXTG-motif cell wall-anchored protein